jgi:hypothetical protein
MSLPPTCGALQPGTVPGPFNWQGFAAVGTGAALIGTGFAVGKALLGASTVAGAYVITAGAAGAAAIFALVLYYAFKADGCIIAPTKGQNICISGIVQDSTDESSTAVAVLAPYAMGPAGIFDLVVKSMYFQYVSQNAFWVYCNSLGTPMLPCVIKSKTACGAKIGSLVGVSVGAIAGAFVGYFAAAALGAPIGCAASGPFYLLCLLIVLIVAAIVAAAVAIAGAIIGGWIGEGIAAAANSDPVLYLEGTRGWGHRHGPGQLDHRPRHRQQRTALYHQHQSHGPVRDAARLHDRGRRQHGGRRLPDRAATDPVIARAAQYGADVPLLIRSEADVLELTGACSLRHPFRRPPALLDIPQLLAEENAAWGQRLEYFRQQCGCMAAMAGLGAFTLSSLAYVVAVALQSNPGAEPDYQAVWFNSTLLVVGVVLSAVLGKLIGLTFAALRFRATCRALLMLVRIRSAQA